MERPVLGDSRERATEGSGGGREGGSTVRDVLGEFQLFMTARMRRTTPGRARSCQSPTSRQDARRPL